MAGLALSFRGGKTRAARILNSLGVPPALPYLGISRAMINRVDYDFVVFHLEHYLVGKFVVPLDGLLGVEISFWRESRLHFTSFF